MMFKFNFVTFLVAILLLIGTCTCQSITAPDLGVLTQDTFEFPVLPGNALIKLRLAKGGPLAVLAKTFRVEMEAETQMYKAIRVMYRGGIDAPTMCATQGCRPDMKGRSLSSSVCPKDISDAEGNVRFEVCHQPAPNNFICYNQFRIHKDRLYGKVLYVTVTRRNGMWA